ncbi:chemotaxis protein CheV [Sutcliffiella cohnii]|uniref:Chemotaxis protein CheV n=1 Tax=Sutcliffiella cohnii TaxID=33932 RepID=A0A223KQ09_9BACI|nr:chemotaxis protein [Sutcliffiella cohnii]AST91572.1 chemotaxis protein CheV [Sutcliffiella cohnii]
MEWKQEVIEERKTNEVEILQFTLDNTDFGINVLKVREIILPSTVTKIPHSHQHVEGIIELRGEVLPVINLRVALGMDPNIEKNEEKFIIAEFNSMKVVMRVDHVSRINRFSWDRMEKPESIRDGLDLYVTSVLKLEEKMVLILDVEKILYEIYPNLGVPTIQHNVERANKKVVIVEDSPMLRQLLQETLLEAGYENLILFENGQDALTYLQSAVKEGNEQIDVMITDIEMPLIDGLTLTKIVKEDSDLKEITVIIFSSLITDQLRHKGEKVGADDQISKPQLSQLIDTLDKHASLQKS